MTIKHAFAGLLIAGSALLSYSAMAENGAGLISGDVSATAASHGQTWYTAAINSTGTVAGCLGCNKSETSHLGTGIYQVAFSGSVSAAQGYSRWVQVDTLTTGTASSIVCTTADRSGVINAVWVECYNTTTGATEDTSFFLFVAR